MIDREAARRIALEQISQMPPPEGDEIVLQEEQTLERHFGWVFFYASRRYQETGDVSHLLVGNAPLIVDRRDGSVHFTGTGRPVEHYLLEYEREHP